MTFPPLKTEKIPVLHGSASQVETFRLCPRKHYETKVLGKRQPDTDATLLGKALHDIAQAYLETFSLREPERSAVWNDFVDRFGDEDDDPTSRRALDIFLAGQHRLPSDLGAVSGIEHYFEMPGAEVPVIGYIDLHYHDGIPVVLDHKTTKSKRWIKTPDELASNVQMNVYAKHILDSVHPEAQSVKLRHVYYLTGSVPGSAESEVVVTRESVDAQFETIKDTVNEMVRNSRRDLQDVPQNWYACQKFGGCPFLAECHQTLFEKKDDDMSNREIDKLLSGTTSPAKSKTQGTDLVSINPPGEQPDLALGAASRPSAETTPSEPTRLQPTPSRSEGGNGRTTRTLYLRCFPSKTRGEMPLLYSDFVAEHTEALCKQYDVPHLSLVGSYGDGYKQLAAMVAHGGWPDGVTALYIHPQQSKSASHVLDVLVALADEVIKGE